MSDQAGVCSRCGHLCPNCAAEMLPDKYVVVYLGRPSEATILSRGQDRDKIAQQIVGQLDAKEPVVDNQRSRRTRRIVGGGGRA